MSRNSKTLILGGCAVAALGLLLAGCSDDDDVTDGIGGRDAGADLGTQEDAAPDDGAGTDMAADDAETGDSMAAAVEQVDCATVTVDMEVDMESIAFDPAEITISSGQVVRWTNLDTVPHTVTSGRSGDSDTGSMFDSGNLNESQTYCLRFNETGEFLYFCEIHPTQMNDGVVTVQ